MRKGFVLGIIVLAALGLFIGAAQADVVKAVSTNERGSLLIWPKIDTTDHKTTLITISNDLHLNVNVKCYFMADGADQGEEKPTSVYEEQEHWDFQFRLTPHQPFYWDVATGMGDHQGEGGSPSIFQRNEKGALFCWAVSPDGTELISFNYLMGTAVITDGMNADSYNAYAFKAIDPEPNKVIASGSSASQLLLDNNMYEACPKALTMNYFVNGANVRSARTNFGPTSLLTMPCKQDLRLDFERTFTYVKLVVWDENEVKHTGAFDCQDCWEDRVLDGGIDRDLDYFNTKGLLTDLARARIKGIQSSNCENSEATPMIGLQTTSIGGWWRDEATQEFMPSFNNTFTNELTNVGIDETGVIKWTEADGPEGRR